MITKSQQLIIKHRCEKIQKKESVNMDLQLYMKYRKGHPLTSTDKDSLIELYKGSISDIESENKMLCEYIDSNETETK